MTIISKTRNRLAANDSIARQNIYISHNLYYESPLALLGGDSNDIDYYI